MNKSREVGKGQFSSKAIASQRSVGVNTPSTDAGKSNAKKDNATAFNMLMRTMKRGTVILSVCLVFCVSKLMSVDDYKETRQQLIISLFFVCILNSYEG